MNFKRFKHLHFVGIGGVGMCGIAEILLNLGYKISGSDLKPSETTEHLAKLGAHIFTGHQESNVKGADVVLISSAVEDESPAYNSRNPRKIHHHVHDRTDSDRMRRGPDHYRRGPGAEFKIQCQAGER